MPKAFVSTSSNEDSNRTRQNVNKKAETRQNNIRDLKKALGISPTVSNGKSSKFPYSTHDGSKSTFLAVNEMIITPSAKKLENTTPKLVSVGSLDDRYFESSAVTTPAITPPTVMSSGSLDAKIRNTNAIPNSIECDIESPSNESRLNTRNTPLIAQVTETKREIKNIHSVI